VTLAAGASSNVDLWAGLEVAGSNSVGLTIQRTLALFHVRNFAAAADAVRVGMIVDDLDLIGTTRQIASNFNKDWYWWTVLWSRNAGSAGVNAGEIIPSTYLPFDIRSRRKSSDMGRTSILAFQNGAATSITIDFFVRQLVALP
jgi:hypothetical protein